MAQRRRRRRNPAGMNTLLIGAGVLGGLLLLNARGTAQGPKPVGTPAPGAYPPATTLPPAAAPSWADTGAGSTLDISGLRLVSTGATAKAGGWRVEQKRNVSFYLSMRNPSNAVTPFTFTVRWVRRSAAGFVAGAAGEGFRYAGGPYNLQPTRNFEAGFSSSGGFLTPGLYAAFLKVMSGATVLVNDLLPVQNWDIEVV